MSYKARSTSASQSKPQFKETSTFDWNSIRNLVEKEQNAYIKTHLILSCLRSRQQSKKETTSIYECDLLLSKFIEYFSFAKLFPNFVQNYKPAQTSGKVSKKDKIRMDNQLMFQANDFKLFSLGKSYEMMTTMNRFTYDVSKYLYILYWNIEILKALRDKKNVTSLVILDACISLNRLLDRNILKNENYLEGFRNLQTKVNSLMNESFYNLLFKNPKFLVHCSFQNYEGEVKLYPEQQTLIDDITAHVLDDRPILLGTSLPTGQGKSFSAACLAKRLSVDASHKTLLFACSNELVNNQLAADTFCGDGIHLWLAKHNFIMNKEGRRVQKFLLRPHKSAFKINWKRAYKENNDMKFDSLPKQWYFYSKLTQRSPDIIISDLECCLELLKHQEDLEFPFVLFLDEFVTTESDAEIISNIIKQGLLPKQTILSSSVLPKFENMPMITEQFCKQYNSDRETCCIRQSSYNIKIPCCVVDVNGYVGFPHHMIRSREDLTILIENMRINPRIRRSYASKYVYYWVTQTSVKNVLPQNLLFHIQFPNIGKIEQNQINEYVILILEFLKDNFEYLNIFQEYKPWAFESTCNDDHKFCSVSEENIFTTDTFKFDVEGKTLVVTENPTNFIQDKTKVLFEKVEKFDTLIKRKELQQKQIEKDIALKQNKGLAKQNKGSSKSHDGEPLQKKYSLEEVSNLKFEMENLYYDIPNDIVLNTSAHFKRFHGENKKQPGSIVERKQLILDDNYFSNFSDQTLYELYSGIVTFDSTTQTMNQKQMLMDKYESCLFFVAGKEIIFGTNLGELTNIYLPELFAKSLSLSELYQLMGRVGRVGVSNYSTIMTCDAQTFAHLLSCDDNFERECFVEQKMKN